MGENNPVVINLEAWILEARSRYEFLSKTINLDELITRQRLIVADRTNIRDAQLKAYSLAGQNVNGWSASSAVLACYLIDAGRHEEALAVTDEAFPEQQKLVENDNPDNSNVPEYDLRSYVFRQVLSELLSRQAEALFKLGKSGEATKSIRRAVEVIEPFTKPEPCYLYDLARYLALASTFPDQAGIPDAVERAVKSLQQFIASGFDNPYRLNNDDRLAPLRTRPDFQTMVKDLEAKLKTEEVKK